MADMIDDDDLYRDPHYPAGWWILASIAASLLMIGGLLVRWAV